MTPRPATVKFKSVIHVKCTAPTWHSSRTDRDPSRRVEAPLLSLYEFL